MLSLPRVGVVLLIVALIGVGLFADSRSRDYLVGRARLAKEYATAVARNGRREALLAELQPVTLSNCEPVRVGSAYDGGYAMCGNLMDGIETAYSYGIGGQDDWGCEVSSTHRVPVHEYDCFEPTKVQCPGGVLQLNAECVGPRAETIDGRSYNSLTNQIARNGDSGKRKLVKMDVEGAEWQTILATPDDVFESIVQMPMELHGTDRPEVLEGLKRLKKHFYLVSVHFNNWIGCEKTYRPVPSGAYQVLLVNKNIGVLGPPPTGSRSIESALAPDNPQLPECPPRHSAP